ncbi:LysM peptidoglycan-binding domain-containing protein [Lactobacillus sp. LC28-10]|uniref:LysM peptidoglycan-binding domain-containing protein n=1 Tax=Secundilactobacillus angelensis TaxID=2722706 RepID=A0ABX1KYA5_9LACO|nr:LysM peptidoglycan-binding domain-containing protein [Secundilactobacillus angelensis]MCH5462006.1 LysM peptidoglycan-binding domain-containing protein [Secundilactobacillus angelensis]NLR18928.1 LysM peptidoglycan-binding domain-containing protein [Secundilactobacillus angelensis]
MLPKSFVSRSLLMFGTLIGLGFTTISASAKEYTVKSGDSLWGIAKDNNTTTKAIVDANSLGSAKAVILPNQKLTIPNGAKADKSSRIKPLTENTSKNSSKSKQSSTKLTTKTATSGWTTMVATAYDPEVAAGGQGTSIPTGTGVAAALDRYPKGTELEIKFQDGHTETRVVNDTGTFAASNPNQLDISMTNAQAMQFGRQSIQVRVIG